MKCAVITAAALCLSFGACSGTPAPARLRVADGAPVELRIGESARAADGSMRFGFEQVTTDSRCPKNVQCIWAGDAVVRVWWQHGSGPREVRELHTSPGGRTGASAPASEIRLLRLEPWPVAGRPVEASDYIATLATTPAPAVDAPER